MSISIPQVEESNQNATGNRASGSFAANSDVAIEVLRAEGQYGRITEMARDLDVDRRRLYEVRERAEEVLADEFDRPNDDGVPSEPGPAELADDKVLFNLAVTVGHVKRVIIALRVISPASIRDIVCLLPILFAGGASWSFGTVQKILTEAGKRAKAFSLAVALSGIECVVLDEMFSQNRPVLAGLDIATQYLFLLAERPSRTGEEWHQVLEELHTGQGLTPERVVKDAGTGLAKGVGTTWNGIEQRDDCFHAIRIFGQAKFYLERRALGAISREYEAEQKRERLGDESARRSGGQEWRRAKEGAKRAIERFDAFEKLSVEAQELLKLTRPGTGELYTENEVKSGLERVGLAMMQVGGNHARKAGRYLKNRAPGLAKHLRSLGQDLAKVTEEAGGEALLKGATRLYQAALDAKSKAGTLPKKQAATHEVRAAIRHLVKQAEGDGAKVHQAIKAVFPVLEKRERASSAIENFNSVLRPYLVVHKNVQQNFLDLFGYYWNMRIREWGKGKGTSAYEQLSGVRATDWLETLGYPAQADEHSLVN